MTEKYFYAVGRRKTSSATVHLSKGTGNILVKKGDEYVKIEDFFT
jgi:ribosomal protein S9